MLSVASGVMGIIMGVVLLINGLHVSSSVWVREDYVKDHESFVAYT